MTEINRLNRSAELEGADLLPIWDADDGATRAVRADVASEYFSDAATQIIMSAITAYDGTISESPSWADIPKHSDPNFGNALDAQSLALAARTEHLRGLSINVKDPMFAGGAKGDGVNNDAPAIQAAINYAASLGGGVVDVPAGAYAIYDKLRPASNVTLRGEGIDASRLIIPAGVTDKNSIIHNIDPAYPTNNFVVEGIGFVGQWEVLQSEISDNGLVTIKFATNLVIRHCGLFHSRGFALNINECDGVTVEDNLFEYAPRDMIAVWGTPNVKIINNTLRHNDDDGISVNLESAQADPVRSKIIITGNIMEDTGPIRTQAPKNIIICNNNISRPKGTGILVGVNNTSTNDTSSGHAVLVTGNVITDVIDRQWFVDGTQTGSVNSRIYISVQSIPTQAGALPVAPGEVNPATGLVQSPYDFYYKTASITTLSGSIRAPNGIVIRGNICKRTLPAVSIYSDWGYGQAYTKNGFVNYQVPDAVLRGMGARVYLPIANLFIDGNLFEPGREGIRFDVQPGVALANRLAKNVVVTNNHILDTDQWGVYWVPTSLSHQEITIEGNNIDCDPSMLSANRGAQGTWTNGTIGPTALKIDQLGSAAVLRNKARNCAAAITQSGVSATQYIENNMVFADASSTGFSASNKGVGTIPPIGSGEQWWIQYEDSDPTSATYKQSLGANLKNQSGMPTTGKYLTGMIVMTRPSAPVGTAGSQYMVIGHLRRTTGTSHVLNTDWTEMRVLTGT